MLHRLLTAAGNYLRTPPGSIPRDVNDDIREEIETHLVLSARDRESRGASPEEARRDACERFGGVASAVRACQREWSVGQVIWHRLHLLLTVVLLAGVAYLFIAGRAPGGLPVAGDIEGRVVDEQSQPVGEAHILAVVKTWPLNGYRQQAYMTTTDRGGRFRIGNVYPTDAEYEVQLAVVADRRLLESRYVRHGRGRLEPFSFTLRPSEPIVLRFQSTDGAPLAGVEVFPHRRVDPSGDENLVYFDGSEPVTRQSNAAGEARLPYFAPGDRATVYLRPPDGDWQTREVEIPRDSRLVVLDLHDSHQNFSQRGS